MARVNSSFFTTLQSLMAVSLGLSFLLGNLVSLSTPLGAIRPIDIAASTWLLVGLPQLHQVWKHHSRLLKTHLLFLVWLGVSTLLWATQPALGLVYVVRWGVMTVSAWTLSVWAEKHDRYVSIFLLTWLSIGVGQYLFFPDSRLLFYLGWDDHLFRAFGSVFDPLFFGVSASAIAWYGFKNFERSFWLSRALFLLSTLAVTLSFSRLALLSVVGWLAIESLSLLNTPKKLIRSSLAACWVCFFLFVILVPKDGGGEGQKLLRTTSILARQESVAQDLEANRTPAQWVVGSGWFVRSSALNKGSNARQTDAALLQLLFSAGGMATVLWVIFILKFSQCSRVVIWLLLGGLVSPILFSPWVLYPVAFLTMKTKSNVK